MSYFNKLLAVTYEDLAEVEGCAKCSCCTFCQQECGCVGEETEDDTILRVFGLPQTAAIKQAQMMRQEFELEEEEFFGDQESGDVSDELDGEGASSESEED